MDLIRGVQRHVRSSMEGGEERMGEGAETGAEWGRSPTLLRGCIYLGATHAHVGQYAWVLVYACHGTCTEGYAV